MHEELRRLCEVARALADQMPGSPKSRSPRSRETSDLRSTRGGGGKTRVEILDQVNIDAQIMIGHLTFMVEGVADLLEAAVRRDNAVNGAAATVLVRSALELAGQLAWLLDDQARGDERARRYLIWRFADLTEQRRLLGDFRVTDVEIESARLELDQTEQALIAEVESAKWHARANGQASSKPAALIQVNGSKAEELPKLGQLVGRVASTTGIYKVLSASAHSARWSVFQGLIVSQTPDEAGRCDARLVSGGMPIDYAIGLAAQAIDCPCRLLARWNGVSANGLRHQVLTIMRGVGISV